MEDKNKIKVLVHFKKWIESEHPLLDGEYIETSKLVEVDSEIELDDMFKNIIKIKVINN